MCENSDAEMWNGKERKKKREERRRNTKRKREKKKKKKVNLRVKFLVQEKKKKR